jgi:hypothetical protein
MNPYADWLDSLWCLIFTLASLGGWLWLYWDLASPMQQLL